MASDRFSLFCLSGSRDFGDKVSRHLDVNLGELEERDFEDGEHKSRPLQNVRDRDVFVVHSLYSDTQQSVNDKLCRLLYFIGALRDASASRVTAMIPYICYARKDRKTKSRDPVTTRYLASLFESVGTDRVVVLEVHNLAAFQNAFRCHTDHLEAKQLFANYFATELEIQEAAVVSPDVGGIKRAELFRQALAERLDRPVASAFMEKHRSAGVVSGDTLVGDLKGKTAIIIDDLIATGGTIARTAEACHAHGARRIFAAATHGLFVGEAQSVLANPALEKIVITDSIPPFRLTPDFVTQKVVILDASRLVADAIRAIHSGGSIVDLLAV